MCFTGAMLMNAILIDSMAAADLAGELDRARRLGLTLNDPDDLNTVHIYIAELEARLARKAHDAPRAH